MERIKYMAEPMITIKKSDGSFTKVPLSEFKKMQTAAPKPAEPAKPAAPAPVHAAAHHTPAHHAAKQHPVHIKEEKKEYHAAPHHTKPMSRTDAGSPLEEKLKIKSSAPLFSPKREKQVEEVLGKLGFSVMPDILGRLKSLVLAKLKDIKSEDETRELLSRSIKNGGLGLTEQQIEKIITACRAVEAEDGGEEASVPALKGNYFSSALNNLESELDLPAPSKTPAVANTINNPLNSNREKSLAQAQDDISKLIKQNAASEPVFKLDARPAMKQSMQDVTASSMEMGPVEEMKSVTLMDFRRLSGNPEEAAKRLQQKMFTLQEESFVWYLEALAAYHNSPLYLEYIQAVCQSLAERKSLANVLSMKNSIKLNEVMALVEMEKGL